MKRRFLIGLISLVFILFLIGFVSTWVDNGNSIQSVDGCNQLNTTGATYTLTSNVSSNGTCFTITRPNITLDCNGYWINYSINGSENTYGIYSNQFNTTIKNCNIVEGNFSNPTNNKHGISIYRADNSTIFNNYINIHSSHSIDVRDYSTNINITKNTIISDSGAVVYIIGSTKNVIENNTVISNGSTGIMLYVDCDNSIVSNNNISSLREGNEGIYVVVSDNVFVVNNTVTGAYTYSVNLYDSLNTVVLNQVAYGGIVGLTIWGSNNSIIKDCINLSGNQNDVSISSHYLSVNNTFINCSYDSNKEYVRGDLNNLIRKWYYQAYVNNTGGSPLSNANISASNTTGQLQFTTQTNSSGYIPKQEVTEYVNTGGTRRYYNNYTINATSLGYETDSNILNFTTTKNKLNDVFTLQGQGLQCGTLNSANTVYTLTQNVSSQGTCFTITQPNITLDCNGHWINYSINGNEGTYGIYTNQYNTTIKNCNIVDGNWTNVAAGDRRGIYLRNVNGSTIFNNHIKVNNSAAIMLEGESNFNNVTNNIVYSGLHAIDIQGHNNIISNNFANSSGVYY